MVEPWALKNSRWKKWVVWRLFERAHLSEAACLHALCEAERGDIRALGLTNPIAVIPNGVDLPPDLQSQPADPAPAEWRGRKVMLFLSRVHPKKGLVQLVRAWAALHRKADGWVLAIAGPPQGGHDVEIQRLVDELALGDTVRQVGPQYGEDKNAWLRRACAFVLPSFSEGMPVAVLEALAYGLPVLLTPHCNLPEAVAAGAAFAVALRPDDIAEGLQQVLGMSDSERKAMGARGRSLVERKYTWPRIALQMAEVYKWVLGGGPAPETVECC
jgi:poly(glycerol-phosphate) alpha-glucosyltransferase